MGVRVQVRYGHSLEERELKEGDLSDEILESEKFVRETNEKELQIFLEYQQGTEVLTPREYYNFLSLTTVTFMILFGTDTGQAQPTQAFGHEFFNCYANNSIFIVQRAKFKVPLVS